MHLKVVDCQLCRMEFTYRIGRCNTRRMKMAMALIYTEFDEGRKDSLEQPQHYFILTFSAYLIFTSQYTNVILKH